ncbi:MAG: CDP-glycerol glycerophosphotransferase family protein, partial [Clostridia bacterium]|nr:CDP-glycerol glycerophosphotransferase family protein [Clostridia bacterium]
KQVFRLRRLKDESAVTPAYVFSIIGDMWHIASAKVVIVDTYSIPVSCLDHKKDLKVVQIWHALGAVKKFGLQSVGKAQGRAEGVSRVLCMHRNYDYVIAPSKATADVYCQAFGCGEENIKILSLPGVDSLLDGTDRRQEFLSLNPDYEDKKIVAYIPTFRNDDEVYAQRLYETFAEQSSYKLVVSAHPLSKTAATGKYRFNGDFSSRDLMKLCHVVITDYSACAIEASLLNKPLYFYTPDYGVYTAEQGLNVDLKAELPLAVFDDAKGLLAAIDSTQYDFQALRAFSGRYVENKDTDNTEQLSLFICSLLKGE